MKTLADTHPYRIWMDSVAGYSGARFTTLDDAVKHAETYRSPFHFERIDLNGQDVAIVLPTYYWEKN